MGRRKARLSSVYGLLKKEGEYTAVSRRTEDPKSNGRNNFIPMGMHWVCTNEAGNSAHMKADKMLRKECLILFNSIPSASTMHMMQFRVMFEAQCALS